ncbi:MAG: class IV adenylate cyclase [Acidobacteria bacterium]|nr:MAG: class IV adenylate cyclase [Acidobacteriota bacterium]
MTYRETEIKLFVPDLKIFQQKLFELGVKSVQPRHFEDNFLLDTVDSTLRRNNMLLRIRVALGKGVVTMKKKARISDGVKDREEIECEVDHPEEMQRILAELGYSISFRYQKYRTIYKMENISVEIFVDETPIGNYVELEGEIGGIHELAAKLGYSREAYVTESYATLYFRWCQQNGKSASQMIF